jgi:ABC-type multidrug transport system fused ATPase/permease subunit
MFQDLLSKVTKAPVNLFFDVTPMGKLMSNFTSDINKTNSRFFDPVNWVFKSVFDVLIKIGFALYFSPFMIFAIATRTGE